MAGLGWLDSLRNVSPTKVQLRIDGGLGLVRLSSPQGQERQMLRIDGGLGLVRLRLIVRALESNVAD